MKHTFITALTLFFSCLPPLAAQTVSSTDTLIISKKVQTLLDKGKASSMPIFIHSYGDPSVEHSQDLRQSRQQAYRVKHDLVARGIAEKQIYSTIWFAGTPYFKNKVVVGENKEWRVPFTFRTNLLYWLLGTPNLGVEWLPSRNVGILVDGAFTHWKWKDEQRQYRMWMVSPQVRWYLGMNKCWYIGLEGHIGELNLKLSNVGRQGNLIGGGLTGGYKLYMSRVFDMDFSLGLGYTRFEYDSYTRGQEHMLKRKLGQRKNLIGPTEAGISLVWKIN
jgi:hypothetical protein